MAGLFGFKSVVLQHFSGQKYYSCKNMHNSAWAGLAIGAEIGGDALAKGGFKFHLQPARKKWRLREDSNPQPAD